MKKLTNDSFYNAMGINTKYIKNVIFVPTLQTFTSSRKKGNEHLFLGCYNFNNSLQES